MQPGGTGRHGSSVSLFIQPRASTRPARPRRVGAGARRLLDLPDLPFENNRAFPKCFPLLPPTPAPPAQRFFSCYIAKEENSESVLFSTRSSGFRLSWKVEKVAPRG